MLIDSRSMFRILAMTALLIGPLLGGGVAAWGLGLEKIGTISSIGSEDGLLSPSGFCYDSQRDKFIVADTESNKVLLLDRNGNQLKVLGRKGQLSWPLATSSNRGATLFIAERERQELKVVAEYDSLTTEDYQLLDLSRYAQGRPVQPVALFSTRDGTLYVCDRGNRQLLIFNQDRSLRRVIPKLGEPVDVWVKGEKIYLADPGFGGVRIYNQQGQWERTLGDSTLHFPNPLRPRAIAVDRRDRLWVLDEAGAIYALDALGNPRLKMQATDLFIPVDLALDNFNSLYVLERGGQRITVFRINEY